MIRSIYKYFKLLGLVIQHGKLPHRGINYNKSRAEGLMGLAEYIPINYVAPGKGTTNPFMAQAAFLKNSFHTKGGHLQATSVKLSYIRIPKSASTSMSMAMLEKIYPTLNQKKLSEKQINFLTDVNLQQGVSEISDHNTYFTIVRNPFNRLVSVYRDFFESKTSSFIYNDYLFGVLKQHLSFDAFVDRITCIPDRLKDQHLKPQCLFIRYYEHKNIPVKILKLEESDPLNSFLSSYHLQLPHLNKSNANYDYKNYYSPSLLKKVYTLYQNDIEKFGYEDEYKRMTDSLVQKPHSTGGETAGL